MGLDGEWRTETRVEGTPSVRSRPVGGLAAGVEDHRQRCSPPEESSCSGEREVSPVATVRPLPAFLELILDINKDDTHTLQTRLYQSNNNNKHSLFYISKETRFNGKVASF